MYFISKMFCFGTAIKNIDYHLFSRRIKSYDRGRWLLLTFKYLILLFVAFFSTANLATSNLNSTGNFTLFESGQVRPLSMSPNGKWLFAVNTPASKLEVFRVHRWGLIHKASVQVGLEPVAVAARNNDEVWVVNHLSDHGCTTRILPGS